MSNHHIDPCFSGASCRWQELRSRWHADPTLSAAGPVAVHWPTPAFAVQGSESCDLDWMPQSPIEPYWIMVVGCSWVWLKVGQCKNAMGFCLFLNQFSIGIVIVFGIWRSEVRVWLEAMALIHAQVPWQRRLDRFAPGCGDFDVVLLWFYYG